VLVEVSGLVTVMVPERVGPVLVPTLYCTPVALVETPESHVSVEVDVHVQPLPVVTVKEDAPPAALGVAPFAESESMQPAPWFTVNEAEEEVEVLVTVTVAMRGPPVHAANV